MENNVSKFRFEKPSRTEYRISDRTNYITGESLIIRHNPDGPAVITDFGYKAWYINGVRHRLDGPAIEYDDFKVWYVAGNKHRMNGPAVEYSDGSVEYWENGHRIK